MSAARELLDRFAEIGATVRPAAGDHLIVRAGANRFPPNWCSGCAKRRQKFSPRSRRQGLRL
jgi:hypothetical protein